MMQVVPGLSKGRKTLRDTAVDQWAKTVHNAAAPLGAKITATGREGAKQLKAAFDDAYSKVWGSATHPSNEAFVGMVDTLTETARYVGKDGEGPLRKIGSDLMKLSKDFDPKAIKTLDHTIKKQIRRAARAGDTALEEGLNALRKQLRATLPKGGQDAVSAVDSQYGKYLVVKKAGAKAKDAQGHFTPKQLMDSVGQVGGETRTFLGNAPLQDFADAAFQTVGRKDPNILLDAMKGLAVKFPSPTGLMKGAGDVMLGHSPLQKGLQRTVNPVAEALRRKGVSGGTLASGMFGD
jgi:hypothetical protein